jgi:multiple sugar transport system substrate-binding protein
MPPFASADGSITDQAFWERELKPIADETGCKINVEIVPWDSYEEKYTTGVNSNEGPDIGYMYMEMFYDYIHNDQLEDVDQYFTDADKSNYLYYDLGNIQGGQYGLPVVVGNPRVLIGNMDILSKAGITAMPTTWDELVTDCKAVMEKEPDVTPLAQAWGNTHFGVLNELFWPYFWSAGASIVDADGNLTVDTAQGLEAAQFIYDLRYKDNILNDSCTSTDGDAALSNFKDGKVAFEYEATGNATRNEGINWSYSILAAPEGGAKTFVAADCLVMLSSCKDKPLAAKAMKLMTSTDVMKRFHTEVSSQMPITKDEEIAADDPFKDLYANDGDKFQTLPVFEGSAEFYDYFYKDLQSMMQGQMKPEDVLKDATDYYNSNIKE